ncbi:TPA: hypothetical protein HA238_01435 [Candidatus Micrarchaeota archaeon]|nr:hypothetical protein [Candidatus Micrarchaeota archaeon]
MKLQFVDKEKKRFARYCPTVAKAVQRFKDVVEERRKTPEEANAAVRMFPAARELEEKREGVKPADTVNVLRLGAGLKDLTKIIANKSNQVCAFSIALYTSLGLCTIRAVFLIGLPISQFFAVAAIVGLATGIIAMKTLNNCFNMKENSSREIETKSPNNDSAKRENAGDQAILAAEVRASRMSRRAAVEDAIIATAEKIAAVNQARRYYTKY